MSEERAKKRDLPVVSESPVGLPSNVEHRTCRSLRTKNAFGSVQSGAKDWRSGESSTAVYWCLRTMETFGEDGGFAHPERCREGRGCYAAIPYSLPDV